MTRFPFILIVVAMAVCSLSAGCGDGGNDAATGDTTAGGAGPASETGDTGQTGGSTTPNNPEEVEAAGGKENEFTRKVNAVCESVKRPLRAESLRFVEQEAKGTDRRTTARELATGIIIPGLELEVRELRRIDLQGEEAEQVDAVIAEMEAIIDKAESDPVAFILKDAQRYRQSVEVADGYGLTECGRP